jgi:hypothetical protein
MDGSALYSLDPARIYDQIVKAGEDWADKQAAADLLEETRKSVLAKLMIDAAATTQAGREMQALADPTYTEFVEGMVQARKAANKARVRYDSAKVLAELRRSQEATRRAEASIR